MLLKRTGVEFSVGNVFPIAGLLRASIKTRGQMNESNFMLVGFDAPLMLCQQDKVTPH